MPFDWSIVSTFAAGWGMLMALAPALQIRRMLQLKSSRDVSIGYFAIMLPGSFLWLAHGWIQHDIYVMLPNFLAILVITATIVVALRLRRLEPAPAAPLDSTMDAS